MTVVLYRKGGKKRVQGHLVTMLHCAEDRVDELCDAGWATSPRGAYSARAIPRPTKLPDPKPKPEKIYEPDTGESYLPKPKKKSKKKG